jgi:hypothetical protein
MSIHGSVNWVVHQFVIASRELRGVATSVHGLFTVLVKGLFQPFDFAQGKMIKP